MFMNMAIVFLSNRRANRPSGFSQFLGSIANRRAQIQKIRRKRPELDVADGGRLGGLIIGGLSVTIFAERGESLLLDERELMKKLVLAWDPDFTKLTPTEAERLRIGKRQFTEGESFSDSEIDWDTLDSMDLS
jgi:hypothetical protein